VQPVGPDVLVLLRQHHDRGHVHPVADERGGEPRGLGCGVVREVLHEPRQRAVQGHQDGVVADERDVVRAQGAGHADDDGRDVADRHPDFDVVRANPRHDAVA
jgi:hypothetical protein